MKNFSWRKILIGIAGIGFVGVIMSSSVQVHAQDVGAASLEAGKVGTRLTQAYVRNNGDELLFKVHVVNDASTEKSYTVTLFFIDTETNEVIDSQDFSGSIPVGQRDEIEWSKKLNVPITDVQFRFRGQVQLCVDGQCSISAK